MTRSDRSPGWYGRPGRIGRGRRYWAPRKDCTRSDSSVARYIRDRLWHPSQKLRELPDGRLELSLRVADTLEVRRWILGYGGEAEVAEPDGLREALRREAESLARKLLPARKTLAKAQSRDVAPRTRSSARP